MATVHESVLGGDVRGAGGKEEYYHCGDFSRGGHVFFERNLGCAVLEAMVTTGPAVR